MPTVCNAMLDTNFPQRPWRDVIQQLQQFCQQQHECLAPLLYFWHSIDLDAILAGIDDL
jgi:hypothetical protein